MNPNFNRAIVAERMQTLQAEVETLTRARHAAGLHVDPGPGHRVFSPGEVRILAHGVLDGAGELALQTADASLRVDKDGLHSRTALRPDIGGSVRLHALRPTEAKVAFCGPGQADTAASLAAERRWSALSIEARPARMNSGHSRVSTNCR